MFTLIRHLPPGSALQRELDPEGAGKGWSLETQLIAVLAEVSDQTNAILATVYGKKGARTPKALEIDRPGRRSAPRAKPLTGKQLAQAIKGRLKDGRLVVTDKKGN